MKQCNFILLTIRFFVYRTAATIAQGMQKEQESLMKQLDMLK